MKIAFLNIYNQVVDRGAENFVKEIAKRLSTQHQVTVYSANYITEPKARSQTPLTLFGKILYKLYLDAHSQRALLFTLKNIQKIIKTDYDWVIPVDAGWQLLIIKLLQVIKIGHYKILISGQAGIGRDDLRNLRLRPDIFVALTSRAEKWAKIINKRVTILKIPNGVDLDKFNPDIKPAQISLEKPIIICVAGLNQYKRVQETIQAISSLAVGSLLLLGDGPQRSEIDRLGQQRLGDKRYLRLTVPYAQIPSYYKAANVFSLVSESSEAFGTAYVEAMACGLPVVATDDQMRHEIVGDAGLFVNPTNTTEYASAIQKALSISWFGKPRKQAQKFNWDEIAKEYETAMANMLR